uniref:Uncharacterized protein n=1 Tax=Lactuca sativa TaxID=4236 RepID=A0A9R1WXG8_LACSA|nr:hypothetical protein LSAT_V11C800439690 [Lactuca sativa]
MPKISCVWNKEHVMLMLCTIVIAIPLVQSVSEGPKAVQTWFKQELPLKQQKSNITSTSITGFGLGFIFDNPMTVGPDPWSMRIGRGQGIDGTTTLEKPALETPFKANLETKRLHIMPTAIGHIPFSIFKCSVREVEEKNSAELEGHLPPAID